MKNRGLGIALSLGLGAAAVFALLVWLGLFSGSAVPVLAQTVVGVVVADDAAMTSQGTPISLNVLTNDQVPLGYSLQIHSVGTPSNGSRSFVSSGTVTYTPKASFIGTDSFTYTVYVCDTNCYPVPGQTGHVTIMAIGQTQNQECGGAACTTVPSTQSTLVTFTLTVAHPGARIPPVLELPVGSIVYPVCFFYEEAVNPFVPVQGTPSGFLFAGRRFELKAYVDGQEVPGFQFNKPVTMILEYSDDDVQGLDEDSLALYFWDGAEWGTDGVNIVDHDKVNNTLTVRLNHLSDFALFARGHLAFLPVVMKVPVRAPDLVIASMTATADNVTMVLKNQGDTPVEIAFWVDAYFDPDVTPELNMPWHTIAAHGCAWGVTAKIPAGGSLALTTGDQYYRSEYSSPLPYPVGAKTYAFVDSLDYNTNYGAVWESNENNNLYGPIVSAAQEAGVAVSDAGKENLPVLTDLPAR